MAVKAISLRLLSLPQGHEYRVIFMQRPLSEVLASQEEMMRNLGTGKPGSDPSIVADAFERNLRAVNAWLESKAYIKILRVPYHEVLRDAEAVGRKVVRFLDLDLNVDAMARRVDATLYRNRSQESL